MGSFFIFSGYAADISHHLSFTVFGDLGTDPMITQPDTEYISIFTGRMTAGLQEAGLSFYCADPGSES